MAFDFLKRFVPRRSAVVNDAATNEHNTREALQCLVELQRRLTHMQAMDGLQNVAAGLGTARDKRSYTGYSYVQPMQYAQAETYYRSNWVCANIVDVRGTDMNRAWYSVLWDGIDTDSDRQQQLTDAEDQFGFRSAYLTGTIWGRLYGGGALVFGIKGQDPEEELDIDSLGKDCLEYIHVFDRWQLSAVELMDKGPDLASPNFRKPRYYVLGGSEAEAGVRVHWSRVVVLNGREIPYRPYLQNGMWHDSELLHVIEDVKDYSSVMALLATMFFEANVDVMMIANLAQTLAQPKGEEKINRRFGVAATQKSANRMLMMDANDRYEKKGNNFTGLGAIVADFRSHICAAARTPATKLFGESPGGMNATGESDEQNYDKSIAQAQTQQHTPQVRRGYRILTRHVFGEEPKNFHLEANPLRVETRKEKAERELIEAQRDQVYMSGDNPAIGPDVIARELKENKVYKRLEDADVAMVKSLEEQATEAHMEEAKNQAALLARSKGQPKPGEATPPPKE